MLKLFLFLLLLYPLVDRADNDQPSFAAARVYAAPHIDAEMNDSIWERVPVISRFKEVEPTDNGLDADRKTEVRIAYTNEAVYVFAQMYDNPDSVWRELTPFDDIWDRTDLFYLCLDTYHDNQNAFCFGVSSMGVKEDGKFSGGSNYDITYSPAWEAKTKINKLGWCAEYKIPLSALRFPKTKYQDWGINCIRKVRRTRQQYCCPFIDLKNANVVMQYARLKGIEDIDPPLRLSVTPYLSAYNEQYSGDDLQPAYHTRFIRAGMDLKWGINESYTLDMTLVPDFGQVKSDNLVYNLTPFEVQYSDNRPFFTEGAELFNFNNQFYSRRIGQVSDYYYYHAGDHDSLVHIPSTTQLLNATKITGRSKNNVSVGVLNAVTGNTYADNVGADGSVSQKLIDPLTNFNVVSVSKIYKNSSQVEFFNTNVVRAAGGRDANVATAHAALLNKKASYGLLFTGTHSIYWNKDGSAPVQGYFIDAGAEKVKGNFLFNFDHIVISPNFESNDLGYQTFYDFSRESLNLSYSTYEPKGKLLSSYVGFSSSYSYTYSTGTYQEWVNSLESLLTWKHYLTTYFNVFVNPVGSNDFYSPEVAGHFYKTLPDYDASFLISTDYRKHVALDVSGGYRSWFQRKFDEPSFSLSPRLLLGKRCLLRLKTTYINRRNEYGHVENETDGSIVFGQRSVRTVVNTLTGSYILRPNMNLSLNLRHYWSRVEYSHYYLLQDNGNLSDSLYPYASNANANFNAFNVDFDFIWQFFPGSELDVVFKNAVLGDETELQNEFIGDVHRTFQLPQTNSLSVKVLYYLDWKSLHPRSKH